MNEKILQRKWRKGTRCKYDSAWFARILLAKRSNNNVNFTVGMLLWLPKYINGIVRTVGNESHRKQKPLRMNI